MKKIISIFAVFIIVAPAMAVPNTNVATTSYVQGAFNALDSSKQDQLQNDAVSPQDISATVKTTVAVASSASDTSLATEKAVRTAIDTAATVTVTGSTQYGAITDVSNANGGIQVTKGDAKVQIKSSGSVTGSATMWIE